MTDTVPDDSAQPGILPSQAIQQLIDRGAVTAASPLEPDQVQPASLDLRLGGRAWRVRASFLPGRGRQVAERIRDVAMHELDLTGAVLEKGCVYIAELQERLALPSGITARANPKSSTGRCDVFVRLLSDPGQAGGGVFDDVAEGYAGPLYLEIAPQTFSVLVRTGTRLNQLRLKSGRTQVIETRSVGVDLTGAVAGFRGRRHAPVIDLDQVEGHDPKRYWEPLEAAGGELLLDPGEFYILVSKEAVDIPVLQAAEMTPIDPSVGEFWVHYAGFFDPGFGADDAAAPEHRGGGSRGVLEVRTHDTPFLLEDGQTVARLVYEPLSARPQRLYGEGGGHYQGQGLKLSKHFRPWEPALAAARRARYTAAMQTTFLEDLTVGQTAELTRTADEAAITAFAEVSGDHNPVHLDDAFAQTTQFKGRIAHGMLSGAWISALIATRLPGPGSIYLSQSLRFRRPVRIGDAVTVRATVREIDLEKGRVLLDTVCEVGGKAVLEGEASILAPKRPAG